MMQKLSTVNIVLAVLYVLVYLKSGTFSSTAGILITIIFNWMGLRSFQLDDYRWRIWHYIAGSWTLYFVGTLIYGSVHILGATIEFNFISNDVLTNLIFTLLFCVLVIIHFIRYGYKNIKQLKFNH